jgi:hypothetical protein
LRLNNQNRLPTRPFSKAWAFRERRKAMIQVERSVEIEPVEGVEEPCLSCLEIEACDQLDSWALFEQHELCRKEGCPSYKSMADWVISLQEEG